MIPSATGRRRGRRWRGNRDWCGSRDGRCGRATTSATRATVRWELVSNLLPGSLVGHTRPDEIRDAIATCVALRACASIVSPLRIACRPASTAFRWELIGDLLLGGRVGHTRPNEIHDAIATSVALGSRAGHVVPHARASITRGHSPIRSGLHLPQTGRSGEDREDYAHHRHGSLASGKHEERALLRNLSNEFR